MRCEVCFGPCIALDLKYPITEQQTEIFPSFECEECGHQFIHPLSSAEYLKLKARNLDWKQ